MSESWEVIDPGLSNGAEYGIFAKCKIANHHGCMTECLVKWIRVVESAIESLELNSAGRAFGQRPCITEETV